MQSELSEKAIMAVVLAGGQARRMGGGDKGLLELGEGWRLLDEVFARARPQVAEVALNANGDLARFSAFGVAVVPDTVAGFLGPLAGLLAGLDHAAERGLTHVLSLAADTPFFPTDLALRLAEGLTPETPIALAATSDAEGCLRAQPTFGLWPVDARAHLRASLAQGARKVSLWADQHGAARVAFETTALDPFFNVNTPEDLARARAIWGALSK